MSSQSPIQVPTLYGEVTPAFIEKAQTFKSVSVMGLGYVGLPTALMFARGGFEVFGVDVNPKVLDNIDSGAIGSIYPELADWANSVAGQDCFKAGPAPVPSDVFLITVPTPVNPTSKRCDLTMVKSAMQAILEVIQPGNLVVLESTVPPGTTRKILKPMLESAGLKVGQDVHLCFSPERVLPGNTVHELVNNHRIMGSESPESAILGKLIFGRVISGEIYTTDDTTAEFCKLAENTYRDVNIALANELSLLADAHGIEMKQAQQLMNMHPRVKVLTPGIGVGGHCIAVDPWFFVEMYPDKTQLISAARRVNDHMPRYCADKIMKELEGIPNPKVCAVGLTYKPDVADVRESPALKIVDILREKGAEVVTFDPLLPEYANTTLADSVTGCDYLAILVPHTEIKKALEQHEDALLAAMRTPKLRVF